MGDLNEWMAKAKAYDSLNERIGDLATKLHERDMRIRQLEEEAAATNELLKRSWDQAMMAEERAKAAKAREVELLKAVNDAYPTIAGHVISLERAGETVAYEQWERLARQLYEAAAAMAAEEGA